MERPEIVTDEHLQYLDELRESGETNMFGAGPYLREWFGVTRSESHAILKYWMGTFKDHKHQDETPAHVTDYQASIDEPEDIYHESDERYDTY